MLARSLAREVARYFRFPLEDERLLSYRCSFCGWTGADVSHIIEAGHDNSVGGEPLRIVAICDRCVDVRRAELANESRLPIEELRERARAALATSPQEWIVELEDRLRRVPPSLDLGPGHCSFCGDESPRCFASEAGGGICESCVTSARSAVSDSAVGRSKDADRRRVRSRRLSEGNAARVREVPREIPVARAG